jgi:phosphodiesterase/alkaline phosphatase D-like protein
MRKKSRMFAIAEALRARRTGVTAQQLAERFGVTLLTIYRDLVWGDLAQIFLLDTRQYRSDQLCLDEPGEDCGELETEDGTLLGATQESWLEGGLTASAAIWNRPAYRAARALYDRAAYFVARPMSFPVYETGSTAAASSRSLMIWS